MNENRLEAILRGLMDIYSPSGQEADLLDWIAGHLIDRGVPVVRQLVEGSRYNLVVLPARRQPLLAFIGHVDTVPAHDGQRFGYRRESDRVCGLGAADMKGGCAAIMEAVISLWECGLSEAPVALALVVGEEETGDGARALREGFYFPWAIIAEPTDMAPCLSQYGYLEGQVHVQGERMHAAMARPAGTPVEQLLELLNRIAGFIRAGYPAARYNIRDLFSVPAGFAVPESCEAWLDLHFPPTVALSEIRAALAAMVETAPPGDSGITAGIRFHTCDPGYRLPENGPVVQALKRVYQDMGLAWTPQGFASHCDANLLGAAETRTLILGPGSLETAHAPDEWVRFSQVRDAARCFEALGRLLAESAA